MYITEEDKMLLFIGAPPEEEHLREENNTKGKWMVLKDTSELSTWNKLICSFINWTISNMLSLQGLTNREADKLAFWRGTFYLINCIHLIYIAFWNGITAETIHILNNCSVNGKLKSVQALLQLYHSPYWGFRMKKKSRNVLHWVQTKSVLMDWFRVRYRGTKLLLNFGSTIPPYWSAICDSKS